MRLISYNISSTRMTTFGRLDLLLQSAMFDDQAGRSEIILLDHQTWHLEED